MVVKEPGSARFLLRPIPKGCQVELQEDGPFSSFTFGIPVLSLELLIRNLWAPGEGLILQLGRKSLKIQLEAQL